MASDLKITVEKPATWSRRMTVTIPAERLEQEKQTTARKLAQKIKLPGFRKGKVPATVLEKRFGPAIEQETIERVVGEAYREAVQREGLQPITQAAIDKIDYAAGSDLTFYVDFDVKPEIELNRLGGFRVQRPVQPVGDEAVDRVIQGLREEHAVLEPVDGEFPTVGDVVNVSTAEGSAEPRAFKLVLGKGRAHPEIEERIRGLRPGEETEFDIDLPENPKDPNSALKPHHLVVKLLDVERPRFPDVDDDFAKSLGQFDSVADLRQRVRSDLERQADERADQDVRRALLDEVLQANPFDVPNSMIDRYLEQMIRPRQDEDQSALQELRQAARPHAEQALRRMLVIERVAELEGLDPAPEELEGRYQELADRYGRSTREIRAQLKKEGREHEVEETLTEEKVFRYLESLSTIE